MTLDPMTLFLVLDVITVGLCLLTLAIVVRHRSWMAVRLERRKLPREEKDG